MIYVFDMSGVFFNNGLKIAVNEISEKFNLKPEKIKFVLNGDFAKKYRTGMIEPEDFWSEAKKYLKADNIEEIKKIFFTSYHPHQESVDFIKKLKKKGVKMAFLSNGPKDRTEFLDKKYDFISLFDFGLFSFEAHAWKPDLKIYKKFLSKFSLNPENIVYIDDKEKNLSPAKKLGMKTVLFENIIQLGHELNEF